MPKNDQRSFPIEEFIGYFKVPMGNQLDKFTIMVYIASIHDRMVALNRRFFKLPCFRHTDIPECTEQKDACGERAICTEKSGSYQCRCPQGYHFGNRKRDCFRKYARAFFYASRNALDQAIHAALLVQAPGADYEMRNKLKSLEIVPPTAMVKWQRLAQEDISMALSICTCLINGNQLECPENSQNLLFNLQQKLCHAKKRYLLQAKLFTYCSPWAPHCE